MSLKCGIVGLPNIGKSTIFNCLSKTKAQVGNFPFCTIKPNIGTIIVPDERLHFLAKLIHPQKIVQTNIEIIDIAGLVKGASTGDGLGNQFLATIRQTDAILHVLRCFDDANISHTYNSINPIRDKEIVDYELQLKDLEIIESCLFKIHKQTKTLKDEYLKTKLDVLIKFKKTLMQGKSAITVKFKTYIEQKIANELRLLTNKPTLYVCNVDEHSIVSGNDYTNKIKQLLQEEEKKENRTNNMLIISASIEAEIAELKTYEEQKLFLKELGLKKSGVNRLIKSAYKLLNMETFLTVGHKEIRAWTYIKGSKALQCAGIIHSDFKSGFIRAEVIKYHDFIKFGSEILCKESGKLHIEGKEYVVEDGDIINFRFNI